MKKTNKAFTLIELSVVLVVVSFMLAGALSIVQATTKIYKEKESKKKMQLIQFAIRAYFTRNNKLPFPADPTLKISDPGFGVEIDQSISQSNLKTYSFTNQGDSSTSNPKGYIIFGSIPVLSLGLKSEDAFDMYGNKITYVVHSSIASQANLIYNEFYDYKKNSYQKINTNPCLRTNLCPKINSYAVQTTNSTQTIKYLFPYNLKITVDNRSNNGLQDVVASVNNVAYAIISHGENGKCAWNKSGGLNELPTSNEKYNCFSYWSSGASTTPIASSTNYKYYENLLSTLSDQPITLFNGTKTTSFDDILLWDSMETLFLTASETDLYSQTGSQNSWVSTNSSVYYPDSAGKVGIGTSNPLYPLHIEAKINKLGTEQFNSFAPDTSTTPPYSVKQYSCSTSSNSNCNSQISIYTQGQIVAQAFSALSDQRIKNIISYSDKSEDFEKIKKLKVTNYQRLDNKKIEKKLIAQEVEKIYPQAISTSSNFVPNIMSKALVLKIENNIITTEKLKYQLKKNDIVKVADEKQEYQLRFIGQDKEGNFQFFSKSNQHNIKKDILIYGTFIKDLKSIDYEAISMLNLSAMQHLINKIDKLEQELNILKQKQNS
jgi:prepilin-type N-terminal cleavage/methylation domain-containing protein